MKKIILFLCCGLVFQAFAQSDMSTTKWQEDLRFLQQTVHNDYSFLFKKTTAADFDKAVEDLYREIPQMDKHEIIVGMARIVSSFKYGHTQLGFRSIADAYQMLPINLYQFSDGVYVQGVHKGFASVLGAKVIAVEGMPIEKVIEAIYPVVPVENDQYFKAYGFRYLISPQILHAQKVIPNLSETVTFTFEKNGKTFTQQLKAMPRGETVPLTYGFIQQKEDWLDARDQSETPLYLKNLDKIYFYEYLPEAKTVYVRQSQIQDDPSESIPEFYDRVFDFIAKNDVEKLVLDVRLNGGGNNYKNKAVITRIIESKKINKVGSLFTIIGRRTFSACQNLVNELDNYTNTVFMGEPTGENVNFWGDNNRIELPNSKLPVYLSFAWWQDKPQWEGAEWTAPHIAIDMSFKEYITNEDPVLDMALYFKDTGFVLDPMQYMTNLYMAGEQEKLLQETQKMVQDPRYKFFDFEGELNNTGYQALNRGDHELAIAVFSFNTQLFSESPNTWDSLAEGYWKAGNKEKAKEYYNKALAMDPDGPTGRNATEMLRRIEGHE
jgi:tetratricopeptide (TPR) repeat protein